MPEICELLLLCQHTLIDMWDSHLLHSQHALFPRPTVKQSPGANERMARYPPNITIFLLLYSLQTESTHTPYHWTLSVCGGADAVFNDYVIMFLFSEMKN